MPSFARDRVVSVDANEPDGARANVLSRLVTISSFSGAARSRPDSPRNSSTFILTICQRPKDEPAGRMVVKMARSRRVAGPNVVARQRIPTLPEPFRLDGGGAEGNQKQRAGYWLA